MCGIAGIVAPSITEAGLSLEAMLDAQSHRGPDACGGWSDGICALGHRRLSIIDLSAAGRQPLSNEDGTIWITFNGEIYNFQTLRCELAALGHGFRTQTDTEVIVHAYEQWGTDCVRRLRGMFAFAVWDQRRRCLFLARDRVGKKPLVYTQHGERFLFASELQGLLADRDVPRSVDLGALDDYLSWGYVPAPRTAFHGIRKLPPAHWLTLELSPEGPVTRSECYWRLDYGPKLRLSEAEACEALRERLTEAVRLRMVSDVPVGAFLSGGIDSSIVVGLMARLSARPVKTFSIGFPEAAYSEVEHARRVAARCGAERHEFVVQPDALSILPKLVRHFGEPFADESAVPTFYLSQLTRQHVTVALNGDGGDESFAGYERYLGNQIAERLRVVPGTRMAAAIMARALSSALDRKSRLRQARRFLDDAHRPMPDRYARWIGLFSPEAKAALYHPDLRRALVDEDEPDLLAALFGELRELEPVDRAMAVDVRSYLPEDLLAKVDITSMANGMEARSPLLDHEVMEFAARLPVRMKVRRGQSKYLLKRAFADLLPVENCRRRKMGFGAPVGEWFRGPLRELVVDTLLSSSGLARGYFQPGEIHHLVNSHLDRRADHSLPLWGLLVLELWGQEFLDSPRPRVGAWGRDPIVRYPVASTKGTL